MKKVVLAIACMLSIAVAAVAQEKDPPPPPPPPVVKKVKPAPPPIDTESPKRYKAFLERNKSVERLRWKSRHIVVVTMKDKTSKTYDLNNEKMKKDFEEAFGAAPVSPPPPPPPAPPANPEG